MYACRLLAGVLFVALLAGCGGSGEHGVSGPPATPEMRGGDATVGPFVMRSAAAASMQIEDFTSSFGISFAVFSGVTIDYIAVRELMDRAVFVSTRSGETQLWVCDFFGDNPTQITFNDRVDANPAWSRDGTMLAWDYSTTSMGTEILSRPAGGGTATNLTNDPGQDSHPTWSPDGRWIAFETDREGDWDIYKMLADGCNQTPLTADGAGPPDFEPEWAPDASELLYMCVSCSQQQIWHMEADGSNRHRVFTNSDYDRLPTWRASNSQEFAYRKFFPPGLEQEIYLGDTTGASETRLVTADGLDDEPCFSTAGDWIFFMSDRTGSIQLWAKQVDPPYRLYQITDSLGSNWQVDLGSPTVQTSRVLIGPPGSDHGYDPIHDAAVAGVVAYDHRGYANFVRLGVPSASGASLTATPLVDAGVRLVGIVLSAPDMYYLEEDAGLGIPPTVWDFTGITSRTAALYFDGQDGKLVAVMDMGDSVHTASAASSAGITHEQRGSSTIARGDFRRVYDRTGQLIAEAVGAVELDAANRVVRSF